MAQGKGKVGILTTNHFNPAGDRMIYGGAERYGIELTRLLLELGYDVEWWQIGGGWRKEILPGVPLRGIPVTEAPLQTFPHLNQAFAEQAMDVDYAIYFVTFLAYPQVLEKSIAISHGIFWDYPTFDNLLPLAEQREEWRRRLWIALTGPQKVVSVDTATIQWATATWPGLAHRFVYIPNFADCERFAPLPAEARDGKVRVLFPRRLTTVRGINEAARAAEVLCQEFPEVEFHFVGRAHDDAVEKGLSVWAEKFPNIYYYWDSPEEMPRVYQHCEIVWIPSKSTEGTSLACLEAMAAGCAVITSAVGGLADLVFDNFNGLVIKPTAANLVEATRYLLTHPEERRRLGANARQVVEASFSRTRWRERWEKVLTEVFR